jgi:choline dehydrogenase
MLKEQLNEKNYCDYLVIGGGSSGSVVASRLSENSNCRVILLEAGAADTNPLIKCPAATSFVSSKTDYNWNYQTEPQREMNNRRIDLSQAKVLGGGSSINAMVYTRGHPRDYNHWQELGCNDWSYEDVLPFFKKSQNSRRGSSRWHGEGGLLQVTTASSSLPATDAILRAAKAAGIPRLDDFCSEDGEGLGYYDTTIGDGKRSSASTAFLEPARQRENLEVYTHSRVSKILFKGGRAVGAEVLQNDRLATVYAEKEVVLCAGAVNTAQLLMLSGVGPAEHLSRHEIPVELDVAEVGKNFQNHVAYAMNYSCSQPITAYRYMNPLHAIPAGMAYLFGRKGYLGACPSPLGGFIASGEEGSAPDLQCFLVPGLITGKGWGLFKKLPSEHGFMVMINQGRPYSRGEVLLNSGKLKDAPRIEGNYLQDSRDLTVLARGIERMREIFRGEEIAHIGGKELFDSAAHSTVSDIKNSVKKHATSHYHVAGTCRMGSDKNAVVDNKLRLKGIAGLRIADASVIPELINGNTNAPVMMIAERAAEFIKAES